MQLYRTFFFALLGAWATCASFGQHITSFEYPTEGQRQVFSLSNEDPLEPKLLVFSSPESIELVFLDEQLELRRKVHCPNLPGHLRGKQVIHIQNQDTIVQVFMNSHSHLRMEYMEIHKIKGSFTTKSLKLESESEQLISKRHLHELHIFPYGNRLYKIWVDNYHPEIHILYCELEELDTLHFMSVPIPAEGLAQKIRKKQLIPTPLYISPWDAQVIDNAKEEKMYMMEDELIISMENQEEGHTYIWALNTVNWQLSEEVYPVKGFQKTASKQKFNSYLYGGYLYQILYNKAGLHLYKVDFESKAAIQQKSWASYDEFQQDFGLQTRRRTKGSKTKVVQGENHGPWKHFKKSISISLTPEEGYDRVILGSHTYISLKQRNAINIARGVFSLATSLAIGFGVSEDIEISLELAGLLFEPIFYFSAKTYRFREGRTFQGDSFINTETFRFSSRGIHTDQGDQINEQISQESQKGLLYYIAVMEYKGTLYTGFGRDNRYYIKELRDP